MNQEGDKMRRIVKWMCVVPVAAFMLQGCASDRLDVPVDPVEPRVLTALATDASRMYVFPRELAGAGPVTVAIINVDFSQSHILFDFSVGTFDPHPDRDSLYVKAPGGQKTVASLAELRAQLETHVDGQPVGVVMLLNGTPLGVEEHAPQPEQRDFFRDFGRMMSDAGIAFAYIVPEKLVISR